MKPNDKGAQDAYRGLGMASPQSFSNDTSRKEYNAAYERERQRQLQQWNQQNQGGKK